MAARRNRFKLDKTQMLTYVGKSDLPHFIVMGTGDAGEESIWMYSDSEVSVNPATATAAGKFRRMQDAPKPLEGYTASWGSIGGGRPVTDQLDLVEYIDSEIAKKAKGGGTTYTAGANVTIIGNVISATDTTYTGTEPVVISSTGAISVKEYDATAHKAGLVPTPTAAEEGYALTTDGWKEYDPLIEYFDVKVSQPSFIQADGSIEKYHYPTYLYWPAGLLQDEECKVTRAYELGLIDFSEIEKLHNDTSVIGNLLRSGARNVADPEMMGDVIGHIQYSETYRETALYTLPLTRYYFKTPVRRSVLEENDLYPMCGDRFKLIFSS